MKNSFKQLGDTTVIYLNKRNGEVIETLIDTSDFEKVNSIQGKWHCHYASNGIYVKATHKDSVAKDGKVYLHQLLMDFPKNMVVDHINRDTLDNRKNNLRIVSKKENGRNKSISKRNTSGYKNVRWHSQSKKWQAYYRHDGKFKSLGLYKTKEEAKDAYEKFVS